MTIVERLARFIVETRYEAISPKAVETAKDAILDCIGTGLAGSRDAAGQIAAALVREQYTDPVSTLIGARFKAAPALAALANGTSAHALDYDDGTGAYHGHPSVAIVPAALALGEAHRVTGRDLLAAYVVAYEAGYRIGLAVNPRHYGLGFHATSTIGVFRAAAVAARLLHLDVTQTVTTLAIAASTSCGIHASFGTMAKPLHPGLAGHNGIIAAELARRGFTANADVFEAPGGWCDAFAAGQRSGLEPATENLGDPFCLESPGVVFKLHPSCLGSHSIIDSVIYLKRRHGLDPASVEKIRCGVDYMRPRIMCYPEPATLTEARFSIPYCAAVALLDGQVGLKQFTASRLGNPRLRELMARVEVYVHPSMQSVAANGVELDICLRDGTVLHHSMQVPLGMEGTPITHQDLVAKFRDCAEGVISRADADRVSAAAERLSEAGSLDELISPLGGAPD